MKRVKDILQIETDLLNELEELDRAFPRSPSLTSYSYNEDISDTSIFDDIVVNDFDDIDTAVVDDKIHDLLRSIPGYELFKESGEMSSASCITALKTVDSIKHLVGAEESISITSRQEDFVSNSNVGHNVEIGEWTQKVNMCREDERSDLVQHMDENDDIDIDAILCYNKSQQGMNTREGQNSESMFLAIMEDTVATIAEIEQEKAEVEAEREILYQEQKNKEIIRQRTMNASKERTKIATQIKSAQCLQRIFKENVRRRQTQRIRLICRVSLKLCNLIEMLVIKFFFGFWNKYTTKSRLAVRIQYNIRMYLNKRKLRKAKLSEALSQLINKKAKRKTFFFWKIFSSTMKLQESLIHTFNHSATVIECTFRKYKAQSKLEMLKRDSASIKIQKTYRRYWSRIRFIVLKEEVSRKRKIKAATLIQRHCRGYMIRLRWNRVHNNNYSFIDLDVDKILSQEADDILGQILGTWEDENSNTLDWEPCKRKGLKNMNPKTSVEIATSRMEDKTFDTTTTTKMVTQTHVIHDGDAIRNLQNVYLGADEQIQSDVTESNLKQCIDVNNDINNVIQEWNFTDQRVLKAMMKRKAKMTKNKRKEEISKIMSNPVNRFKRLMKNISKQKIKVKVAP